MSPRSFRALIQSVLLILFGVWISGLTGCGNASSGVISGKVTYKGQPAVGAILTFQPTSVTSKEVSGVYNGTVEKDGTFKVVLTPNDKPVQPGKYLVLVRWPLDSAAPVEDTAKTKIKKGKPGVPADRLGERYLDRNNPLLTVELQSGSTTVPPIELTD